MEKVLTISVAAYNVEKYVEELLESVVKAKNIDKIEVLVINDGSKDKTSEKAHEYSKKFPNSVFVIDKENANYGSTVNKALELATGKYFRLLDGDDWYNTQELEKFVDELLNVDVDLAITNYTTVREGNEKENSTTNFMKNIQRGKVLNFSNENLSPLGMWAMTYRTEVLRKSKMKLPHGVSYTDSIFCTVPIPYVNNFIIFDYDVYQYRVGRDGQTVSPAAVIKSIDALIKVNREIVDFIKENKNCQNYEYLLARIARYNIMVEKALLLDINADFYNKFKEYDTYIKNSSIDVYERMSDTSILKIVYVLNFIKYTKYYGYWILKVLPKIKRWI